MINTIPFSLARGCLTEIVNKAAYANERIILTRKGKKVAAIISLKDLQLLESLKPKQDKELL